MRKFIVPGILLALVAAAGFVMLTGGDERKTLTEADLTVTLRGGRTLRQQFDAGVAETDLVALRGKLEAKFASLVAPYRAPEAIRDLVALVRGIDRWPNVAGLLPSTKKCAYFEAKLV